jgi:hypothetical protein
MSIESQWTTYRTRFLVRARQLTEPFFFTDILGREQSGRAGDYLVESSDGFRSIAPQTIFEDIYVPVDPSPLGPLPARDSPQGRAPSGISRTSVVAGDGCKSLLSGHCSTDRVPATALSG